MQALEGLGRDAAVQQSVDPLPVAAPGTHGSHIGEIQSERGFQQGDVEFGIVGQHAHDGAGIDPAGGCFCGKVAVRPVRDEVVGGEETALARKSGPRIAQSDLVAQEFPGGEQGRAEVVGAKDQHAGRGQAGFHEQGNGFGFRHGAPAAFGRGEPHQPCTASMQKRF